MHGVGIGPLRGSPPQAAELLGGAPCDPRVSPLYPPPAFEPDELRRNQISRKENGEFWCGLCWKSPTDEWQVQNHLQSKEHERRMRNQEYEADPLACVPQPHHKFTKNLDGWATCMLCYKRMDESHWNSRKHVNYLNKALGQRNAVCNVPPPPLSAVDIGPPLPQPPPPPEQPSIGCGMALGTASATNAAHAQTLRGVREDGMPAASDALKQSSQGYTAFASTFSPQPQSSMQDPWEPVASQLTPQTFAPVTSMPSSLQAPAPRNDQQHPWGSRGRSGQVLNTVQWDLFLQEFDKRYAGDWWSKEDTEWECFNV